MASEDEDQFMCPIHCDILDDPVVLVCQHWFCKGCLREYVDSKNGIDPDCPECREPIDLPQEGVDGLPVNYKMREICRSLQKNKEAKKEEMYCQHHPDEQLKRFCCDCLIAICEDCGDQAHKYHRNRDIGSAWKVVGNQIVDKFKKAKKTLTVSDFDYQESTKRRQCLEEQAAVTTTEINSIMESLYERLNIDYETLIRDIDERLHHDLQKEKEYLLSISECLEQSKDMERYEEHLRKLLSSGGRCVTHTDLDALNSLHNPLVPVKQNTPPPEPTARKFHPSKHILNLLSEGVGKMLTEREIVELEANETRQAETGQTRQEASGGGESTDRPSTHDTSCRSTTSLDSSKNDELPIPTDFLIRTKTRTVLPSDFAHPFDVEPFQTEQQFIVSNMTGAINLATIPTNDLGHLRVINLKPSKSEFLLGTSGITTSDKRLLFSCNHKENYLEKYDIQRTQCIGRIGETSQLTSPRYITQSLTNYVLYVSDIKGVIRAFHSNTGDCLKQFGSSKLLTPSGLATDRRSRLYVADELQSRVFVFDIRKLGNPQPLHEIQTILNGEPVHCHGVCVGRNNTILVSVTKKRSSSSSIGALMEFNDDGQFLRAGGWELRKPRGIRVQGNVATVVDAEENCIVTYHV